MGEPDDALDQMIAIAETIALGDRDEVARLFALGGQADLPPKMARLAEAIGLMVVQLEAREFRLGIAIEDLERSQGELERANYDAVTGLPNRVIFGDRLRKAVAGATGSGGSLALLFIDLDHFKQVNDRMGHHAGDALLRQVGERLLGCVRAGDLIARLGGDEFTAILGRVTDQAIAAEVADRVIAALARPFVLSDGEARIGCSIGIALLPRHGDSAEALLHAADAAMYLAKAAGRNTYRFAMRSAAPTG